MSTRDFSWGKGGRCVRLITYHPRSAKHQENPGPQPTRNPLGHLGLLRDDQTGDNKDDDDGNNNMSQMQSHIKNMMQ
jgi:hypothetical protein